MSLTKAKLGDFFRCLKMGKKICPEYLWAAFWRSIINSVLPFVNIIFSYLILDGLIMAISPETLYLYVGLLLGINAVLGILLKVTNYLTAKYSNIIYYRLEKTISDKNYTLDYEQVEDSEVMELLQKAREGSNSNGGLSYFYDSFFANIFTPILQFVYAVILLAGLFKRVATPLNGTLIQMLNSPWSASIIIVALVIVTLVSVILSKKDNESSYKTMLSNIEANRKFSFLYRLCVNYQYGKDIRLFHMQPLIVDVMSDKKTLSNDAWRVYSFLSIKLQVIAIILAKLLLFVSYAYVGLKAYYGLISIGNVVSYVSAITLLGNAINTLLTGYINLKQQATYLKYYTAYLDLPTKMQYGKNEFATSLIEIEFRDVCFTYPKQTVPTLNHVSFKIASGEKVALVGQNGAGKTTIIKLLCRLYEPSSGTILINGLDIKEYSREAIYQMFSVVFQDFKLFSYSIADNVTSGAEEDGTEQLWQALEQAGIKERVMAMDDKTNTIIYQRNQDKGIEISGGESQKLALARALYKNAPMVILDEPTSALDPMAEAEIYEHFKDMVKAKTAVFISHRMSSCKFCDRIIVLDQGEIVEMGKHDSLIAKEKLYFKMWSAQAKYYN